MKKHLTIVAAAFALTACVPAAEITTPTQRVATKNLPTERIARFDDATLRTYVEANGKRTEVVGATCKLTSDTITAQVVTPARLLIPAFVQRANLPNRGRPSPLRIECRKDKLLSIVSLNAQEKTVSTATNAGIAGAILTSVVSAAIASRQPWSYPTLLSLNLN